MIWLIFKLAERRASKQKKKGGKKDDVNDMDEEDLDALLAQYREEWEQQHATTEELVVSIPSRRANATYVGGNTLLRSLTPCPLGNDLWMFGGEYFDGDKYVTMPDNEMHVLPGSVPLHSRKKRVAFLFKYVYEH